jgi:GntR family transcriptional regulator
MTALNSEDSPVYIKLRGTISAAILRGDFRAGDQLPSVRALAAEHGANPLTVAKAYQSFQDDGYVEVRRGVGMFVLPSASISSKPAGRASPRISICSGSMPRICWNAKRPKRPPPHRSP